MDDQPAARGRPSSQISLCIDHLTVAAGRPQVALAELAVIQPVRSSRTAACGEGRSRRSVLPLEKLGRPR